MARYLLPNVLRDAELFRRLRVRGVARGADGLEGPVEGARLGRRSAVRPDQDSRRSRNRQRPRRVAVAHRRQPATGLRVPGDDRGHRTHRRRPAPGRGGAELAAKAAQVALRAGAYDDVPLLDLVAACLAQEREAEAETYVRQLLSNSGVEREEDLQPRTAEVLFRMRRRWRDRAG